MQEVTALKQKKRGSAAPIYAFIAAWLVCALIFPLYELVWLILSFAVSLAAGIATAAVTGRKSSAGAAPSGFLRRLGRCAAAAFRCIPAHSML